MQTVLRSPRLTEHGFSHGFSLRSPEARPQQGSRADGDASSGPNTRPDLGSDASTLDEANPASQTARESDFAAAVGYAPERLFLVTQVHGREVRVVHAGDTPDSVRTDQGDGLVGWGGLAVAVRTADCLPMLLADPNTRSVAALHAGWRGCVLGVIEAGVRALSTVASAPPERLVVSLFPHIRVCCFEVGEDVAQALLEALPARDASITGAQRALVRRDKPKPHVALVELARAQLMAAGINPANIDDVQGCTRCDAARFFSYRRDGNAAGRHLSAIVSG
jgi:YfiH family protein